MLDIVSEVLNELDRATEMFGPFHSAHEGFAVLDEERDELKDAVKLKQSDPTRVKKMREEAVQVAAMAIRFIRDCCQEPPGGART